MIKYSKTVLLIALIVLISGCSQLGITTKKEPIIDASLPSVSGIKAISSYTEVALEWQVVDSRSVKGYNIYRLDNKKDTLELLKTVDNKYSSHYLDERLTPGVSYRYRISAVSEDGRESILSPIITVKTSSNISSVAYLTAISDLPNKIKIIWRPHTNVLVDEYVIQRNPLDSLDWKTIATVKGRLNAEYMDNNLGNSEVYRYRIIAKTYNGLESPPSEVIKAKTKALPKMVEDLKATTNLPNKIVLTWSPSTSSDVKLYNIYRTVNPYIFSILVAQTKDTNYTDNLDSLGITRYYKVSSLDKDNLESKLQNTYTAGSTLGEPSSPVIGRVDTKESSVTINWLPTDDRADSYIVVKKYKDGSYKEQKFTNIKDTNFTDNNIAPDIVYTYTVIEVDKYGLESSPSKSAVVDVKKSPQASNAPSSS